MSATTGASCSNSKEAMNLDAIWLFLECPSPRITMSIYSRCSYACFHVITQFVSLRHKKKYNDNLNLLYLSVTNNHFVSSERHYARRVALSPECLSSLRLVSYTPALQKSSKADIYWQARPPSSSSCHLRKPDEHFVTDRCYYTMVL